MKPKLAKLPKAPTEAALWARIRHKFEKDDARVYRIEAVATPGFPDVVWCPNMRGPKFIELKAGRLKFRPSQEKLIRDLKKLGLEVYVIWQKELRGEAAVWRGSALLDWDGYAEGFEGIPLDEWIEEQLKGN